MVSQQKYLKGALFYYIDQACTQLFPINPLADGNADIHFSTTVCLLQILNHFLLFWKARTKIIQLFIKYKVK